MENEYTTKSGRTLHLKAVKWTALWAILHKFDIDAAIDNPDELLQVDEGRALELADATMQLFDYCAGWGVLDDPPADELDELAEIGLANPDKLHLARISWLRFVALEDDEEISGLIGAVMALSAKTQAAGGSE